MMAGLILIPLFLSFKHGSFKVRMVMRRMRMYDRGVFKQIFNCASIVISASAVIVGDYGGPIFAVPGVPRPRQVTDLVPVM